jgi:hypothetical protein
MNRSIFITSVALSFLILLNQEVQATKQQRDELKQADRLHKCNFIVKISVSSKDDAKITENLRYFIYAAETACHGTNQDEIRSKTDIVLDRIPDEYIARIYEEYRASMTATPAKKLTETFAGLKPYPTKPLPKEPLNIKLGSRSRSSNNAAAAATGQSGGNK